MKNWIVVLPFLVIGQAMADGFGSDYQKPQTPTTVVGSLQAINTTIDAMSPIPAAPAESARKADKAMYPFGHLTEPMSYLAFAAIIKYQFPGHDAMDSLALATTAVQAYPVYAPFVKFPTK